MLPLVTRTRGWISLFFSLAQKSALWCSTPRTFPHFFLLDGPSEPGARRWGCCREGGGKEENTLSNVCAPTWVAEGDFVSVPVLRCYVFFMRLCQFPLFSRPFPILQVNLWQQFSRFGSIVRLGCSKRGENAENFVESFFPDSDFSLDFLYFSLPWISRNDPSVHFVIKNEENKNHFEKWSRVEKNVVERTNCCGNVLHLLFNLNRKWCFI